MRKWLKALLLLPVAFASLAVFPDNKTNDACPDDQAEFSRIVQRAAARDPSAQTALAFCYDLGRHVQPSRKENIRWLREAANQGYTPAQYELGRIYLYGRGVPADYAEALLWEQKAAEQGDPQAQRDLAFMYERGFGVKANPSKAADWNRKAAAQGQPDAQIHLAQALDEGAGVAKNQVEAREWYARAAKQERPVAQLHLARAYAAGIDCQPAVRWYKEAAAGGETLAMYELAKLYLEQKCGADRAHSFQWFIIGARFGSSESKIEAAKLATYLSPAQRKNAELAAGQWIKKHYGARKEEDEEAR